MDACTQSSGLTLFVRIQHTKQACCYFRVAMLYQVSLDSPEHHQTVNRKSQQHCCFPCHKLRCDHDSSRADLWHLGSQDPFHDMLKFGSQPVGLQGPDAYMLNINSKRCANADDRSCVPVSDSGKIRTCSYTQRFHQLRPSAAQCGGLSVAGVCHHAIAMKYKFLGLPKLSVSSLLSVVSLH